jgi:hypothetical protein
MPEPYADTLPSVGAGRAATVARLRALAARLEQMTLRRAMTLARESAMKGKGLVVMEGAAEGRRGG